jgi:membrane protein
MDRERLTAFARFLLQRFFDDRCFESAGALAYTTMFALVPFSTVVFSVLSAFPVFDVWTVKLTDFLFANFLPASARVMEQYLRGFAESAKHLSAFGVGALLVSILLTMWSIEQALNRIWRVPSPRPKLTRFLMYWTLLTLGSLLMAAALAATSALFSIPALAGVQAQGFWDRILRFLPLAMEFAALTLVYWLIPHRTVPLRFAVAGGALASLLFEAVKWGFAIYLRHASFGQLYGALAVLPIFLIYLYTSWLVVLLGATFASSLAAFRFQPREFRLPIGADIYGDLRLLGRLEESRKDGAGLHLQQIQQAEPCLTDDMLQRMMSVLCESNIVQRGETGAWFLTRDLHQVSMGELYENVPLRVPAKELVLPCQGDDIGRAASMAMDRLRQPLLDPLALSIGSYLHPTKE